MADQTNNSDDLSLETERVEPSETDNVESWDYYDPDEDNVEEQAEATDDETDEAEAEDEATDQETETDDDETDEDTPTYATDDALVKLADGTEVAVKDLLADRMRQSDYSRKTQDLANRRKTLDADFQRFEGIQGALVDYLTGLIPPPPDGALSQTDPGAYNAQKARHDAAVAQLQKLVELGDQSKEVKSSLSEQDQQQQYQDMLQNLNTALPQIGTKEGWEGLRQDIAHVASEIGFTADEIRGQTDHRVFVLAHWAKKGMDAEKAKSKAKEKANAAPKPPRKPGQPARQGSRNREAMKKLGRSGSIRDAMAVDFD